MTGLIPALELHSLFPMKGYSLTQVDSLLKEGEDVRWYSLWLMKNDKLVLADFNLPEPNENGVIKVKETHKVIISVAKKGADYDLHPNSLNNVWVSSPKDVMKWAIRDALNTSLTEEGVNHELLQDRIDAFLAVNPAVRFVDPDKAIDLELAADTVLIDTITNSVDYQQRQYNDWIGRIDIITTSQGRYVGQVFRTVESLSYDHGRMKPGNALFCKTMKKYMLFPENNRPDRLQMARTVFARHEVLAESEDPMVAHESYDGKLFGKHLKTAIASHPLNYYDCIVVSESAAKKMTCLKTTRQTIIDTAPYRVLVQQGDQVTPGEVLLKSGDMVVKASKIKTAARLTKIIRTGTMVGRIPATRYVFHFSQFYPLSNGDKLSSRHSSKGVVRIVPDEDMPYIIGRGQSREPLEVLIHPRSLVGRRNLGVLREMMANKRAVDVKERKLVRHFSDEWSMEELVRLGYGSVDQIARHGEQIGEVFQGPMYWLRTDKHAVDAMSAIGAVKPVDQHGMNPDTGRSGQRFGPDVAAVMIAKGLPHTLQAILREAIEPAAISKAKAMLECLE